MGPALFLEQVAVPLGAGWHAWSRGCSHLDRCQEVPWMLSLDHRAISRALHSSFVKAGVRLISSFLMPGMTVSTWLQYTAGRPLTGATWYVAKNNKVSA